MATTSSFIDLRMWQQAHCFVLEMYSLTAIYPKHGLFGLVSHLRRAAIPIPANIAEGYKRLSRTEKLRFLILLKVALKNAGIILFFQKI